MKRKLGIIWNFVVAVISPTIEQRTRSWVGSETSPRPIHTQIQYDQKIVNDAMNLLYQQRSLAASAPILVPQNGSRTMELLDPPRLALNKKIIT